MKREAKVVRENGRLMAEVLREEACQSCRACRFGQVERVLVELQQGSEYREGETIELEVPDGTVSRGALLAYALPLAAMLAGLFLGARWGAASQAIYVLLGLAGLPIFSAGGGAGYIFYPSFGFLLGLIPAAYVTGRLCGGCKRPARIALACAAGLGVLYLVGLPYMALIFGVYRGTPLPFWRLIRDGMLIFLPGDALKIAACVFLAPQLIKRIPA